MSPAKPAPVTDADIQAYVDGQLTLEARTRVEAAMSGDSDLAARVASLRALNAALCDALDPVLAEPIPPHLIAAATMPSARSAGLRRWMAGGFAAAASLLIGLGIGWFGRDATIERAGTPTTFARQVALSHALYAADVNRPVEIWAPEEKRLVTWLTKRLGFAVHAPDLNGIGYALVGGRLVAGNEKPTAMFMYENADKDRLSLQVRKLSSGTGETAFRYAVEDGIGVFYWIDDACGYAISGKVDRAQLLKIAQIVYGQLAAAEAATAK